MIGIFDFRFHLRCHIWNNDNIGACTFLQKCNYFCFWLKEVNSDPWNYLGLYWITDRILILQWNNVLIFFLFLQVLLTSRATWTWRTDRNRVSFAVMRQQGITTGVWPARGARYFLSVCLSVWEVRGTISVCHFIICEVGCVLGLTVFLSVYRGDLSDVNWQWLLSCKLLFGCFVCAIMVHSHLRFSQLLREP